MAMTNTNILVTTDGNIILEPSKKRTSVTLQNDSPYNIYLSLGEAATVGKGILLAGKGSGVEFSFDSIEDRKKLELGIYGISDGDDGNLLLTIKD